MFRGFLRPWALAIPVSGLLVAGLGGQAGDRRVVPLGSSPAGSLPPNVRTLTSPDARPGRWQIERVAGTPALAQLAESAAGYQLAVLESPRLEHFRAGVRLRMGPGDRAAGLAWRVRDSRNYYAARLDLEAREFVLYKFLRGNRIELSSLSNLRIAEAAWHELIVEHVGAQIRVWLNGIPVASERDPSLSTPGMLGPWLPSDSTAYFAELWYEPVERN